MFGRMRSTERIPASPLEDRLCRLKCTCLLRRTCHVFDPAQNKQHSDGSSPPERPISIDEPRRNWWGFPQPCVDDNRDLGNVLTNTTSTLRYIYADNKSLEVMVGTSFTIHKL